MRYCARCVMPDSRPSIAFDADGICSGCRAYEARALIDWPARRAEFEAILAAHRRADGWDCVVPVSGGKDSTYQVVRLLEMGMHPLAVTSTPCDPAPIGQRNLANLRSLGVDHIQMTPDPYVRARLNRTGLEIVGDISWPEHVGIFTIPVRAAVAYGINLIVWGEDPVSEYGQPPGYQPARARFDRKWLEEHGGHNGLRVSDLEGLGYPAHKLAPYRYPDEAAVANIERVFMGTYLPWDGAANAVMSMAHGFETWPTATEGSLVAYENLDNRQTAIHDWFCSLKHGFGRATAQACLAIRRGTLTRADAIGLLAARDEAAFPGACLGQPLEAILAPLGLDVDAFIAIAERFKNAALWDGPVTNLRPKFPLA